MRDPGPVRGVLPGRRPLAGQVHRRLTPESALIAEHVAHFWWVAWDLRGKPPFDAQTLPHPTVHVVYEGTKAEAIGVPRGRFARKLTGKGHVFGIKFRPAMAQQWLSDSMARVTGRRFAPSLLFGAAVARELARVARSATNLLECSRAAEALLAVEAPAPADENVALRDLVERMAGDPGLTRVEQVAELAGVDVRTLQRRFLRLVGVSPKWVLQRYRLHEAAAQLAELRSLAEVAAAAGYFDQAHFARDFRAVVGVAPSAYLAK